MRKGKIYSLTTNRNYSPANRYCLFSRLMENLLFGLPLTEIVGYFASIIVLLSFLNRQITRLRIINSIGCAMFVVYGFMLDTSWPIVITNFFILLIHLYYLLLQKPKSA